MKMKKVTAILALAGSVAIVGTAQAFVPWSNPAGSATNFDWSGGGSDFGLFGSPILVGGDTFVFFPSFFRAQSNNGGSSQTHDRLQVELLAHIGQSFTNIQITEFGDYGIGGDGSSVTANMAMFITDLNNFRVASANQTYSNNVPGLGNWNLGATVDLTISPPSWNRIQLVLNNNLIAVSGGDNGFAFIEKKVQGIIIRVPTPGSMAMLGLGGLALIRRRR